MSANIDLPIEDLIPHRDRMKLLEAVLDADGNSATTECRIAEDWPLRQDGGVNALVLIEVVAQTAAASIAWKKYLDEGAVGGGKGWLVGIKAADFSAETLPLGGRLITRAEVRFSLDQYSEIHGVCQIGDEVVGEVTLQVMRDTKEAEGE
jgi:predicted hotdog family 3-hydroxylacyl-ACP dehydratase